MRRARAGWVALAAGVLIVLALDTSAAAAPTVSAPKVARLSPSMGYPGTTLTITGTGLRDTMAVAFNGRQATTFTVVSATHVRAVVPKTARSGRVTLTTRSGKATSAARFRVFPLPAIALYGGYYDTHHLASPKPKPDPWLGSPNVLFVGTPDPATGGWDSSAVRIDNLSGSTIANVVVSVVIGKKRFALWGTNSIPAHQSLILAQTKFENFDGSDLNAAGCYGCDPDLCTSSVSHVIPVIFVTVGNAPLLTYRDTAQVLNTRGVDNGCPETGSPNTRRDESEQWQQIARTVPPEASQS